jgi:hypothetical protein
MNHSDMEALSQYKDEEMDAMCDNAAKEDKVVRWQLPVEEDTVNGEYFITFPDDLLEAANLKAGGGGGMDRTRSRYFYSTKMIEKSVDLNHDNE